MSVEPHLIGSQNNRLPDTESSLQQQHARKPPTWLYQWSQLCYYSWSGDRALESEIHHQVVAV